MTQLTGVVSSIVRHRVRDEHEANEVANDAFIQVWLGLPKLGDIENFRSWLIAITIRRALMHNRAMRAEKRRRSREGGSSEDAVAPAATPLDDALLTELRAEVSRLPPDLAAMVDERYFQSLSLREIAEPRALTIDQVFRGLAKAVRRLGDQLRE